MRPTIYKNIGIALLVLLLYACVTRPKDVSEAQSTSIAQQELERLQNWSLRGKLAIITAQERKSANMSWQQQGDNITMVLSSVVGTTIAKLFYDGKMATLIADDKTWQDPSPAALIFQITGWDVPVEDLSDWMKGQVESKLVSEYFENGLVKEIVTICELCVSWKIRYNSYGEFSFEQNVYTLPTSMRLEDRQTKTTLILRIDDWTANDV